MINPRFKFKTSIQNFISGCAGAIFVMTMASAQKASSPMPAEINARRFNLIGEDGKVHGYWVAEKDKTMLVLSDKAATISLEVSDNRSVVTAKTDRITSGTESSPGHGCILLTQPDSSGMALTDEHGLASASIMTMEDATTLRLRNSQPSVRLEDRDGKSQAIVGSSYIPDASGHPAEVSPVSSITLIDRGGSIPWKRWFK